MCFSSSWLVYDDLTDVIRVTVSTGEQRNSRHRGTKEQRNSGHRGTVGTEEQWAQRNSRHRGTEEQKAQRNSGH